MVFTAPIKIPIKANGVMNTLLPYDSHTLQM